MKDIILIRLNAECKKLCSIKHFSILREVSPEKLSAFHPDLLLQEWRDHAPLLYDILKQIASKNWKNQPLMTRTDAAVAMGGAILLKSRNEQMSAIQHINGLLMDFAGTKDKTIDILSKKKLCVRSSTLAQKKKQIAEDHHQKVICPLIHRKDTIVSSYLLSSTVPIYTTDGSSMYVITQVLGMRPCPIGTVRFHDNNTYSILGDNLDHRVDTFHRTQKKKAQDLHWFLLLTVAHNVKYPENLSNTRPTRDIMTVQNSEFIPSIEDNNTLRENLIFHTMEVLVQNFTFLKEFKKAVPQYINHDYVDEMSKKTTYNVLELLDKNESKSDDMIDILQTIHKYVPTIQGDDGKNVIEHIIFGGDVLTNERAYQSQLDMANAECESDAMHGVIHQPEGLHLCMNLCKYILEVFFTKSSVNEAGTLSNLAVISDRRHVSYDMTKSYNASRNFLNDALDSHIVAAGMKLFGIQSNTEGVPSENIPNQELLSNHEGYKKEYIYNIAATIVDRYVMAGSRHDLDRNISEIQRHEDMLQSNVGPDNLFHCSFQGCNKSYMTIGWLKNHLRKQHQITVEMPVPRQEEDDAFDGQLNYASSFMKLGLLYRDTSDAFKMGDGERIQRNIKFLMLHFSVGSHIKYRLWLWRMQAYMTALLSERESFLYKHNMSVNMTGGIRHCIANDNLVEIHIHKMKELMRAMGANITYEASQKAAKCIDYLQKMTAAAANVKSGHHAAADSKDDINEMARCLVENQTFTRHEGRAYRTFPNFPSDMLHKINILDLSKWLNEQKKRASLEMQWDN